MAAPAKHPVLRRAVAAVVAFVVVAAVTIVLALPSIAEWMAIRTLNAQGAGPAELTVTEINWRRLRATGIRIGNTDPILINTVTADFTLRGLLAHRLGALEINGLRLHARMTEDGLSLGSIDPLMKGGGGGQSWTVGSLDIKKGQLSLETPYGGLKAKLEGHAENSGEDKYKGSLRLAAAVTPDDWSPTQVTGTVSFEGSPVALDLLRLDLTADAPRLPIIRARRAQVAASLDKAGLKLQAVVDAAEGRIQLNADGPPPVGPIDQIAAQGTISFDLAGLVFEGAVNDVSVSGAATYSYGNRALDVTTTTPLVATLSEFAADAVPESTNNLIKAPLSFRLGHVMLRAYLDDGATRLDGRVEIAATSGDGQSLTGTLAGAATLDNAGIFTTPEPCRFNVTYTAPQIAFQGSTLARAAASLTGSVGVSTDQIALSLERPLVITAGELTSEAGPVTARAVRAEVSADGAPVLILKTAGEDAGSLQARARLSIPDTDLRVAAIPVEAGLPLVRVRGVFGGKGMPMTISADVKDGHVGVPGPALALRGIDATIEVAETIKVLLRSGELRHVDARPQIKPLTVTGEASADGPGLRFMGRVADRNGRLVVNLSGTHETASGAGTLTVRVHPLTFLPGAFQPRDLLPVLGKEISTASGEVAAGGSIAWSAKGVSSDLRLRVKDLSFSRGPIRVEGINTALTFVRPWPLMSEPNQKLRIARVLAGIPFENASATFQVDQNEQVRVDQGGVNVLGGRVAIGRVIVDPRLPNIETVLRVSGIDVTETLAAAADVDGASGTGRLNGQIPIRFSSGILFVGNGLLEAERPGVLRYKPKVPPPALQGSGERISLVRGALENFHYETLRIELNGQTGGEWTTKLHLSGNNPDFMQGYPFEFNLNLSGMLDEIITRGFESYRHPERLGKVPGPPHPEPGPPGRQP